MSTEPFNDVVLEWLRSGHPDAASIEALETYGSDWAGDTEGGFYPTFSFTIRYVTSAGRKEWLEVEGEDMASLWMFVMRSWPTDAAQRRERSEPPNEILEHPSGERS